MGAGSIMIELSFQRSLKSFNFLSVLFVVFTKHCPQGKEKAAIMRVNRDK